MLELFTISAKMSKPTRCIYAVRGVSLVTFLTLLLVWKMRLNYSGIPALTVKQSVFGADMVNLVF